MRESCGNGRDVREQDFELDRKICICIKYVDGSTSGLYFDGVGCAMRLSKNVGEQF